uniref:Uncharacterized protein n=1 Tax=Kalanchoe fedtschenkoi TaxID=63787 RepID=A0A7N0UH11_KALFE
MALGLRELDLEAGLGFESICLDERNALGGSSVGGNYVARLEKADDVRPLLQNHQENQEEQEHLIHSGIKHVTGKHKKINVKRPPKPPRPPKGPSLDAADLKLIRELSELALEKRMRIERMKDLKKMRASKAAPPSSSCNSSAALIVTVLFCLIILYQGVCSSNGSVMSLESSPGPVLSPIGEDLISIQVFKDLSPSNHGNGRSSETEPSATPAVEEFLARDAG